MIQNIHKKVRVKRYHFVKALFRAELPFKLFIMMLANSQGISYYIFKYTALMLKN